MNSLIHMQILYEIAMEIGIESDLSKTAKRGLSAYLHRLGCAAGTILRAVPSGAPERLEHLITIPRKLTSNSQFQKELARVQSSITEGGLRLFLRSLPRMEIVSGAHYYVLELEGFGVLALLKRGEPFDRAALHGIVRLSQKFGAVCAASLASDTLEGMVRERTEALQNANDRLRESLASIKTLRGLLPICSRCKKIRDDQGYWNQIEAYLRAHSDATFTHGLCPNCIRVLYPEFADERGEKVDGPS